MDFFIAVTPDAVFITFNLHFLALPDQSNSWSGKIYPRILQINADERRKYIFHYEMHKKHEKRPKIAILGQKMPFSVHF